jgi:hypothetical protein
MIAPPIDFLDSVRENHALVLKREEALHLIRDAYDYLTQWSNAGALFMHELQYRAGELMEQEKYTDASSFVAVADQISDLLAELDSFQRMALFRSLHTDIKPTKTSALELMRKLSVKVRGRGIARSKAIYEPIDQVKNMYAKSLTMNKMMNVNDARFVGVQTANCHAARFVSADGGEHSHELGALCTRNRERVRNPTGHFDLGHCDAEAEAPRGCAGTQKGATWRVENPQNLDFSGSPANHGLARAFRRASGGNVIGGVPPVFR